jgi:hypothetical protein
MYELLGFIRGRYCLSENTMSAEKLNPILTKNTENEIAAWVSFRCGVLGDVNLVGCHVVPPGKYLTFRRQSCENFIYGGH